MDLNSPLSELNKVGEKIAKLLKVLGLETVQDLLWHLPFRYDDFSKSVKIKDLVTGQKSNVIGQIELINNRRAHRRKMYITEALVNDGSESLKVIWFNQPFIAKTLKVGDTISLAGEASDDSGIMTMVSPVYEKISGGLAVNTQGFVPVYHSTESITQKQIRFLIKQSLAAAEKIAEIIPVAILEKIKLLPVSEAIKKIHFPKNYEESSEARRRLAFNEIFLAQLKSQLIRRERLASRAEKIIFKEKDTKDFTASLPFQLTDDQKKAAWKILQEMGEDRPMARLLNGDVGSGKTLVAVIALLNTALNGKQAVFMAPTEILARQHFNSVSKLLKNFPLKIALLTHSYRLTNSDHYQPETLDEESKNQSEEKPAPTPSNSPSGRGRKSLSRAEILKIIKNGEVDIIIGTHALVQKEANFKNLALAVIDEQHRFGVRQRKSLLEKSGSKKEPHLLSMTATPIPRSLALILFGDLDVSLIKQMPSGRKPIMTKLVPESKRRAAYDFIRQEIKKGRQVFVVCPLIEESDFFGAKAVESEFKKLDKEIFPEIPTAMLHGKMKPSAKEEIMSKFLAGEYKILIATSVIEVGVDVPNASIMMIEGSERFGLAQLHQFRGRVGRGAEQSYCFLFTSDDDANENRRLLAMEKYADGFSLSQIDLKQRGSGEIYGTIQSGFPEFKIATLFDYELMAQAQVEAADLLKEDADLKNHSLLRKEIDAFGESVHLE